MLAPGLIQKQAQSLVMTPQLRQAIEMLQYTQQDLAQYLRQAVEQNPLLTLEEHDFAPLPEHAEPETLHDDDPARATTPETEMEAAAPPPDLRDDMAQQIRLSFHDPADQIIAFHLLHLLDDAGRLSISPKAASTALGVSEERLEAIRRQLMQFEPVGMFATSLSECLAAQLQARNRLDPAMAILLNNLDLLAAREWRKLRERCALEQEDLLDMLAEIRALNPKPGFAPGRGDTSEEPDVIVRAHGKNYRVTLNTRILPKLTVDTALRDRLRADRRTKSAALDYDRDASSLLRALESRKNAILKVASGIVERQHPFLEQGLSAMRPFTMRELAVLTGLHESTVSRIVSAKTMDTPRGVFAFRIFFPSALSPTDDSSPSATAIQQQIRTLIAQEGQDILSDDALTEQLQGQGIAIQRRTVAKYREALGIPNSNRRRRLGRTS